MANGLPNIGKAKQPGQPMSPTAGPISAAMAPTPPTPGSGAGNFTNGLASVPTPKMKPLQPGDLNNATSIANLVQGYQNQANSANSQRYGQALGVMGNSQDSSNALYGAAQGAVSNVGQQALGRIDQQEKMDLANVQQSGINRGIGNTTIADTMKTLPERNANDARLGVNEMQARLQSGLDTQQAGAQQQYGQSIAGLIGSRNDQAPSIGEYAGLAQGAAAGGNGAAFPHRTGSIQSGGGMNGNLSSDLGSSTAANAAVQAQDAAVRQQSNSWGTFGASAPDRFMQQSVSSGTADPTYNNYSPEMAKQGYGGGSISISPTSGGGYSSSGGDFAGQGGGPISSAIGGGGSPDDEYARWLQSQYLGMGGGDQG